MGNIYSVGNVDIRVVYRVAAHFSSIGPSMNFSHAFQFSSFFSHASNVSSVGGSKPHFDADPPTDGADTTAAAAGMGGFADIALFSLKRPNTLA